MLWEKAWNETRWRFLIGLGLMLCTGFLIVTLYPRVQELMGAAGDRLARVPPGPIGDEIRRQLEIASSYRGYAWSQYFARNLPQQWCLFAALIGTGGVVAQSVGGGGLFTLSLPVSRERLLMTRTLVGLAELAVLAVAAAVVVPLASPLVGQSFAVGEALTYAFALLVGGAVVFALAVWLSTVFTDLWRPALIPIGLCLVASLIDQAVPGDDVLTPGRVLSAASYFHGGQPPWLPMLASAAVAGLLLYAAARNLARRDF